jgi:tRNA dimethylallyltransferase
MPFLLALMGPTASGKTDLAESLAEHFGAQLLNADAFQVYKGLDIGTGKPAHKDRYELLDIVEPNEQFGLGAWVPLAIESLWRVWREARPAIMVGGTGLYVRALFEGYAFIGDAPDPDLRAKLAEEERTDGQFAMYHRLQKLDPDAAARVDSANPRRVLRALEKALRPSPPLRMELPPFTRIKLALNPPADELSTRIEARLSQMMKAGWLDEVRKVRDSGAATIDSPGLRAIGYRNLWEFLDGSTTLESAEEKIGVLTRQYAKRQRTWLRSEPGLETLNWGSELHDAKARIDRDRNARS